MKIAITYDFDLKVSFVREGLSVFIKKLFTALMKYDNSLEIELWSYSYNTNNIKFLFKDLINIYQNRIKINNEYSIFPLNIYISLLFYYLNPILLLRIIKHSFLYIILQKKKSKNNLKKLLNPNIQNKREHELINVVKILSKADYVFLSYPILPLAFSFNCKKIIQIHDLFYLANKELFINQIPDIEDVNKNITTVLNNYANLNTIFISSTDYIRNNHIIKYISNVKYEQTRIIPFPPMIKNMNECTIHNKEDFLNQLNLPEKYIAFPSQNRPNKNLITILKAILTLKEKFINITFVTTGTLNHYTVVSDFVENNNLKQQIIETGNLSENELVSLYKYSSMVVCPNIIEGYGMSGQCLEALTIGGIPVIHAISLGMKESLESVGLSFKTADLNWFEYDDHLCLAEKILDVLNNPNNHIEKQKHIITHYNNITWEDTARNYLKYAFN